MQRCLSVYTLSSVAVQVNTLYFFQKAVIDIGLSCVIDFARAGPGMVQWQPSFAYSYVFPEGQVGNAERCLKGWFQNTW